MKNKYFCKLLATLILTFASLHAFGLTTNPWGGYPPPPPATALASDVPFWAADSEYVEEYKSQCTGTAVPKCTSDDSTQNRYLPIYLVLPDNDPVVSVARVFSWDTTSNAPSTKPAVTCPGSTIDSSGTYSVTITLSAGDSCALTIVSPTSSTTYTTTLSRTGNVYSVSAGTVCGGVFTCGGADTTEPDTTIGSKTPNTTPTNSTTMQLTFSGTDNVGVASYECEIDSGGFSACTSPKTYSSLSNGSHTVNIRAKDAAGNVDATPATYTWTVDATPPTVTITQAGGQNDPSTNISTVNFTATTSEAVTGFDGSDVTIGGTAGATTATVTGSGPYNIAVTGMTNNGTVTVTIAANKMTDTAGNNNSASTNTDNSVTINVQSLVINEIDYDNKGLDVAEFIEIKNVSGSAINFGTTPYTLYLIDGSGGTSYNTINVNTGTVNANDYFVVCGDNTTVLSCDFDSSPSSGFLQNDTEAVVLKLGTFIVDTVSYEGTVTDYVEGTAASADSDTEAFVSLSRYADGTDTGNNNSDFKLKCMTPGVANSINDSSGCYALSINDPSAVTEGNSGTTTITFTVTLSHATASNVTVNYATANDTATAGSDYTSASGTLTFAAGETSKTVSITVSGDQVDESNETFKVNLTSPSNNAQLSATAGATEGVGTITDDDTLGITVNPTTLTISEPSGTATFVIKLNTQPTGSNNVSVAFTASGACTLTSPTSPATILNANWSTGATITVTASDDNIINGSSRTCTITTNNSTSGDTNYNGVNPNDVIVTVTDNDTAGISGAQIGGSISATEGGASGSYPIALSTQPTGNVQVTVTAGTQTEVSTDGVTFSNTIVLTFTNGNWNTAQTVTVKAIDDTTVEGSHTATITHAITTTADGNYPTSLTLGNVTVNIADNDQAPSTGTTSSPSYSLIVQMAGSGTGNVEQTAIPTTSGATRLQLNAVADSGSRFVGWSGQFAPECAGTNPIVTVTVNAIKTCIATFEKIPLKTQAINFAPLTTKQLGDPDFSLSATATSGLTVTFTSATPAICTVTQNTVHLNDSGICNLTAQQLGDNQYLAATPISQSFNVAPKPTPTTDTTTGETTGNTTESPPQRTSQLRGISANGYVDQQPMIVGVYSSGKQRVLIRASGVFQDIDPKISLFTYPDRKLLASNDNWDNATSATELQQKQLAPARQTDAGMLVELQEGLTTVEMTATIAGIGLVEVYDLGVFDGTETSYAFKGFSVNTMLNDHPITAGLLMTGDKRMLLRASALENGVDPELALFTYPDRRLLTTNDRWANSAVQLELQQRQFIPPRETDAATLTEFSRGLFTVEVTKATNSSSGRGIIEIYETTAFRSQETQTIDFAPLAAKQLGDPDFSLSATATSGLTVTFNSATPAICTVTQNIVHLNSIGTCDVTAQQLGDNQYLAATPVSQSFPITIRIDANNGGSDGTHGNTETVSQLRGISANGYVDQQPMIVGVYSSGKQRVLIRASGVFQDIDPKISLFSYPDRKLLASNDDWQSASSTTELQQKQLAPARRTDAGILVELPEGLLTVEMTAAIAGVGLVEVYDLGVFDGTETSYAFKGFSVNAVLNDYPIIAGLLVTGENKRMLLRATGLEAGIDPELEVFSYPDRRLLAANYRWATSVFAAELQQKQLLTPQQTDAATITEFAQGLLTVELTKAVNSRSGRGIVEIYEMTTFK